MQNYRKLVMREWKQRGWSLRELARRSDVNVNALSAWLRDPPQGDVMSDTLAKLAHALSLELSAKLVSKQ